MLYKSKLNLSVILLVLGLGFIPTGFFINGYLEDQVSSEVSVFLSSVKEKVIDDIEANYLGLGISDLLPYIYDDKISEIEQEFVTLRGIPLTLIYLQNATLKALPGIINGSGAAIAINSTIYGVIRNNSTTEDYASGVFFNDYAFQDKFSSSIEGISERMTGGAYSLNYSDVTINRTLYGYDGNPGILQTFKLGTGLLNWLEFYGYAEADSGTNRTLMESAYNCTWSSGQLQNVSAYIKTYLFDIIVKSQYAPLNLSTYAENIFYEHWANATLTSVGLNLRLISEFFTVTTRGLEVGRLIPSNITYNSAVNMWDPLNNASFVNDDGIRDWWAALEGNNVTETNLKAIFELTDSQVNKIYEWLTNVRFEFVSIIFIQPPPIGIGMDLSEYADRLYLEQWTNGTLVEGGMVLQGKVKGFEVGIPDKTNISLTAASTLLDPSNTSSFTDRFGILKWIDAHNGNLTAQNELIAMFNIDLTQFTMITNWLFNKFRYTVVPVVIKDYTLIELRDYAESEFYLQWSDGIFFRNGIDPWRTFISSNFENEKIGETSTSIDFINTNNSDVMCTSKIISSDNEHKKILELYDNNAAGNIDIISNLASAQTNGMIEFEINSSDVSKTWEFQFQDSLGTVGINMGIRNNEIQYYDGSWNYITAIYDNTWNQIKIQFECATEGHRELSADTYYIWINSTRFGPYTFLNGLDSISRIQIYSDIAHSDYYCYLDTITYSMKGFMSLDSICGWELGIPIKSYIPEIRSTRLWEEHPEEEEYSLIHFKGMSVWFEALLNGTSYDFLMGSFKLTSKQMDQILIWLIEIRENFVLPMIQAQSNLPVDSYTLGDNLIFGFFIAGGVTAGLGALGVILLLLTKRK
ncbi:MAG: hypothetical protein ACFFDN_29950 [Candidatus Hodarchaeota archaeon]